MSEIVKEKSETKNFIPLRKALKEVKLPSGETVELREAGMIYHITAQEEGIKEELQTAKPSSRFEAWLAEVEKVAKLWQGEFDAVEDLRKMRNEN